MAPNPKCPSCGQDYIPGAAFCDNCGMSLAQPPTPAAIPPTISTNGGACPSCGTINVAGSLFCENCGASLGQGQAGGQQTPPPFQPPQPPPYTPTPPPYVPPAQAFVTGRIVLQGSGVSLTIPPGKPEVVIGREDPVSNVFPEVDLESHNGLDNGVGRKHAKLVIQGGQTFLEDLQSVNGTSVRGQKLQPGQRVALNNGDEFILGRLKCTYYSS